MALAESRNEIANNPDSKIIGFIQSKMKKVLVDSGHWIGACFERDRWKTEGKLFLEWFEKQNKNSCQIIITHGILTEIIARFINKKGFKTADKVLNFILESDKIVIYDESKQFKDEIYEIFRTYEGLKLVDSEIVVLYFYFGCDKLFSTADEFKRCAGVNCFKIPT